MSDAVSGQASELAQALHLLSWLDEEHRRDRAEIARLQQRIESQASEIGELSRQIQELENRLVSVQVQQSRVPEFGRSVELAKNELMSMIETVEEERHRAEREAARLRLSDVEAQSRALTDLRKRIEILPEMVDRLETRFAEDRRLSQEVVALRERIVEISKGMSDWPARAAFIDEQRAQDAKRIAQLQQEVSELFKRLEPYPGRFELLDEQLRRLMSELEDLRGLLPQINEKQSQLAERYLKDQADTQRRLAEWEQAVERFGQQMERYSKEMRTFREAHDETQRSLENIAQLDERLHREAREVAEAQRVAEERQRREWENWQDENEKRWSRHEMESARALAEVQNRLDDSTEHLADLAASLEALHPEIRRLWSTIEKLAEQQVSEAQELLVMVSRQREAEQG